MMVVVVVEGGLLVLFAMHVLGDVDGYGTHGHGSDRRDLCMGSIVVMRGGVVGFGGVKRAGHAEREADGYGGESYTLQ